MVFSIRIAPGLRVRVSDRGMRTEVGSFAAGDPPTGRPRPAALPPVARAGLTASAATKAQAAQETTAALQAIVALHRQRFPALQRPVAPPSPPVDLESLRTELRRQNLAGVRLLARTERKAAKAAADQAAAALVHLRTAEREAARAREDEALGAWWERVVANDPDVVVQLLIEAFDDNAAPAAPLDLTGAELSLGVLLPPTSLVPDRLPSTTAAGNLSLRKMKKSDRQAFVRELVFGTVLVTIREAFAVAPGVERVRIVALREERDGLVGKKKKLQPMLAVSLGRERLAGVREGADSASRIVEDASDELLVAYRGVTHEMVPLDLRGAGARLADPVDRSRPAGVIPVPRSGVVRAVPAARRRA